MLRVSFMHQFRRGKLADLVSLLSGRDFETKEFREDIIADSYDSCLLYTSMKGAQQLQECCEAVATLLKMIVQSFL